MKTTLLTLLATSLLATGASAGVGGADWNAIRARVGNVEIQVASHDRGDRHGDRRGDRAGPPRHDRGHHQPAPSCPPPPAFRPCPPPPPPVCAPAGYWTVRPVRVWVPARWVIRHDACGRPFRWMQPGYYETRHERVWVQHDSPRRGRHG
jgi:hypothetical protein